MKRVLLFLLITILLSINIYAALTDDLVMYYSFDTDLTEDHEGIYNWTANGGMAVSAAQSKLGGKSALFDGNDDYLSIASPYSLIGGGKNYTICAWTYSNDKLDFGYQNIYGNYVDDNNRFEFTYRGQSGTEAQRIFIRDGGTTHVSIATIQAFNDATWYYRCMVADATNYTNYFNNAVIESVIDSDSIASNTGEARCGRLSFSATDDVYYYDGYYDELAIWSRPLTTGELEQLYNNGTGWPYSNFTTPTPPANITSNFSIRAKIGSTTLNVFNVTANGSQYSTTTGIIPINSVDELLNVSAESENASYNILYNDYNTTENLTVFLFSNFNITAKNAINDNTISAFNTTIDQTTYETTNGILSLGQDKVLPIYHADRIPNNYYTVGDIDAVGKTSILFLEGTGATRLELDGALSASTVIYYYQNSGNFNGSDYDGLNISFYIADKTDLCNLCPGSDEFETTIFSSTFRTTGTGESAVCTTSFNQINDGWNTLEYDIYSDCQVNANFDNSTIKWFWIQSPFKNSGTANLFIDNVHLYKSANKNILLTKYQFQNRLYSNFDTSSNLQAILFPNLNAKVTYSNYVIYSLQNYTNKLQININSSCTDDLQTNATISLNGSNVFSSSLNCTNNTFNYNIFKYQNSIEGITNLDLKLNNSLYQENNVSNSAFTWDLNAPSADNELFVNFNMSTTQSNLSLLCTDNIAPIIEYELYANGVTVPFTNFTAGTNVSNTTTHSTGLVTTYTTCRDFFFTTNITGPSFTDTPDCVGISGGCYGLTFLNISNPIFSNAQCNTTIVNNNSVNTNVNYRWINSTSSIIGSGLKSCEDKQLCTLNTLNLQNVTTSDTIQCEMSYNQSFIRVKQITAPQTKQTIGQCTGATQFELLNITYLDEILLSPITVNDTYNLTFFDGINEFNVAGSFLNNQSDIICTSLNSSQQNFSIDFFGRFILESGDFISKVVSIPRAEAITINNEATFNLFLITLNTSTTVKFNWKTNEFLPVDGTMMVYECRENNTRVLVNAKKINNGIVDLNLQLFVQPYSYDVVIDETTYSDPQFSDCRIEADTEVSFTVDILNLNLLPVAGLYFVDCGLTKSGANTVTMSYTSNTEDTSDIQACITAYQTLNGETDKFYEQCTTGPSGTFTRTISGFSDQYIVRGRITQNGNEAFCQNDISFATTGDAANKWGTMGLLMAALLVSALCLLFAEKGEVMLITSLVALIIPFMFGILRLPFATFSKIAAIIIVVLAITRYTKVREVN